MLDSFFAHGKHRVLETRFTSNHSPAPWHYNGKMTLGETAAVSAHRESPLRRTWHVWRLGAPWIALATLVAGLAVYVYSARQRPVYTATAKMVAVSNPSLNQAVNATLVSAPPLPKGTLEGVLSSLTVLEKVKLGVESIPGLSVREQNDLRKRLDLSIRRQHAVCLMQECRLREDTERVDAQQDIEMTVREREVVR